MAGRWKVRVSRGVDLRTEFSSNVFLEGADDRQQDTMLGARLRINMSRRGSRASANISYSPELRIFLQGTQSNRIVHFLNATGDVELIKRLFGIKASAKAGQSIIDPNASFTQDSFTNPDNVTDTFSLSISPYILPVRLGDFAILSMGINYSIVVYSDSGVQDSLGRDATINLASGRAFDRFTWDLSTRHTLVSYEDEDDNEIFANLTASANYRINRKWQLNSVFGYDNNDVNTTRDINGFFWRLGATYRPNARASFAASVGERYNSTDFSFNAKYRHRRSAWTADYSRNLQTARDEFLERAIFPLTDEFGNPIEDPTLDPYSYQNVPGAALDDTVFIADRFNLGWDWSRRRVNLSVKIGFVRRDDLRLDKVTRDGIVNFNLDRTLSARSSVGLNGSWLNHEDESTSLNDYRQWSAAMSYNRSLSRYMNVNLAYRITVRDAESGDDFAEDRITLLFYAARDHTP